MPVTISLFFDRMRSSELLDPDDVESLWQRVPADKRHVAAEKLAPKLVEAGKLTAYQAEALLAGGSDPLVLGEYVVLGKLGSGGMGQVYKAEHRRMKRVVALKVLSAEAVRSPDAVKRFHREVQAAARLLHENIVTAFDAGEADGVHFLVMECVEGQDLAIISKAEGPLPMARAVGYILQAARGLAYAHGKGVTHRDIKPANLLVDADGTVKILDMGLASIDAASDTAAMGMREQLTQSGQVMGTLDYMAPEQAFDTRTADGRSDIYSLGCTLYRLLTGETLFGGNSLVQVIMAHREQPPPLLRTTRPDAPEALEAILQKMLAKKPEDRQASMAELVAALEALQSGAVAATEPFAAESDDPPHNFFQNPGTAGPRPLPRQDASPPPADLEEPDVDVPPLITISPTGGGSTAKGFRLSGDTLSRSDAASSAASHSSERLAMGGRPSQRPSGLLIGAAVVGSVLLVVLAVLGWNATRGKSTSSKEKKKPSQENTTALIKPDGEQVSSPDLSPNPAKIPRPTNKEFPPLPPGSPADKFPGLLVTPPKVAGLGRWQVETALPRRPISVIAWAPDNRQVVMGGDAGELRIYDTEGWRLLQVLIGHTATITAVAWSPDGVRLASCSNDNTVRLWRSDGTPGPVVPVVSTRSRPSALAFSPSGQWLALASADKNVGKPELFDPNGVPGKSCLGITGGVTGLAWHLDDQQLVTCSDEGTLRRWHVSGAIGKEISGHGAALRGVSWSRSGEIATVDNAGTVYIHPASGAAPLVSANLGGQAVAWSPDGTKLAVGLASSIQIWDGVGKPTAQQQPTFGAPTNLAWSADGTRLAWAGGSAGVWALAGSSNLLATGTAANVVDWSPDGSRFISAHDDDRLRWWRADATLDAASPTSKSPLTTAAWSPSGQVVAAAGGESLYLWGDDRGPQPTFDPKQANIRGLAWNAVSNQLVVAGSAAKLQVWDLGGSSVADLAGDEQRQLTHIDRSRTTGQIAAASSDNKLRYWNSDGTAGPEITSILATALKWNPDGEELAVAVIDPGEYKLRIYSAAGAVVCEARLAAEIRSLAWSPDGARLALGDRAGLVTIWNRKAEPVSSLTGHTGEIRAVAWSKEGRLVSAGDDRTIRGWDAASGQPLWVAVALSGGEFAAITADGTPLGPPAVAEKQLAFLVEQDGGRVEVLSPAVFAKFSAAREEN